MILGLCGRRSSPKVTQRLVSRSFAAASARSHPSDAASEKFVARRAARRPAAVAPTTPPKTTPFGPTTTRDLMQYNSSGATAALFRSLSVREQQMAANKLPLQSANRAIHLLSFGHLSFAPSFLL